MPGKRLFDEALLLPGCYCLGLLLATAVAVATNELSAALFDSVCSQSSSWESSSSASSSSSSSSSRYDDLMLASVVDVARLMLIFTSVVVVASPPEKMPNRL